MSSTDTNVMKTTQNQRDVALGCAEACSDLGLLHLAAKRPDLSYFGWGQQSLEGFDEAGVDGMLFVCSVVGPFKVSADVVGLVSINMVDEWKPNWIWNECEGDEAVHEECLSFAVSKQRDLHVAELMKGGLDGFSVTPLKAVPRFPHSVDASDISKVADFVEAFVRGGGSPLFFNHDVASLQLVGVANYSYTQSVVQ